MNGNNIDKSSVSPEMVQTLEKAFQTGRPQACEHTVPSMRVSGVTPHLRIHLNPVAEDGRVTRVICVSRETTQKMGQA